MRIKAVLVVCLVTFIASPTAATLLFYDPFLIGSNPAVGEYTEGPLAGQNPTVGPSPFFSGAWTNQGNAINTAVQATGLSYLGAPALGGSQISSPNGRPQRLLSTPWDATTTGTFYLGMMVNFGQGFYDDGIQDNDLGYRAVEFWQTPDFADFTMGVQYANAIATARMSFDLNGVRTILENSPDGGFLEDGLTHLLVFRIDLSDQASSDSVFLYLDPTSTVEPVVPGTSATGFDFNLAAMGGFTIFGGSGSPIFDELRVGTTFIDVLPELPLPGDTNGDDLINLLDYQAIISHMNLTGQSLANGDVTGDGKVTIADYRFWKERRTDLTPGAGSAASSAAGGGAPEPSSLLLVLAAATIVGAKRRWLRGL